MATLIPAISSSVSRMTGGSRMIKKLGSGDAGQLVEYVAGQAAWEFPALTSESTEEASDARQRWEQHLASLDTAIFSLLGNTLVLDTEVEAKLDKILVASLFQRRLQAGQHRNRMFCGATSRDQVACRPCKPGLQPNTRVPLHGKASRCRPARHCALGWAGEGAQRVHG